MVAIIDNNGSILSQQRYLPFGQIRTDVGSSITQTDFGFTGQRSLAMGLMDYHARMYDAALGRFIQPDSIVPGAGNPQAFNRYSYVFNDPIGLSDPSGHGENCRDRSGYQCKIHQKHIDEVNRDHIKSLINDALNHQDDSDKGIIALEAVAKYFGIKLPDGNLWAYEISFFIEKDRGGTIYGWNTLIPMEKYFSFNYKTGAYDEKISNDNYVYISGRLFIDCQMNLECIGTTMYHEAGHAWLESINRNPNQNLQEETHTNEEILLSEMAQAKWGDPGGIMGKLIWNENFLYEGFFDTKHPLNTVASYYGYGYNPEDLEKFLEVSIIP